MSTHEPAPVPASAPAAQTTTEDAGWPAPDNVWHRVSAKYAVADLLINLLSAVVVGAAYGVVYALVPGHPPILVTIAVPIVVAVLIVNAILAFRRVKSIGYVLRDDDLLFRRGILFERIIAVPYGRLQLVDITRGPILRALGLSALKFVTASAATGVNLPGLRVEDAEQLRDRLVELAETRRSGL